MEKGFSIIRFDCQHSRMDYGPAWNFITYKKREINVEIDKALSSFPNLLIHTTLGKKI